MPLVGLATLLGGSVFWLRRVGWLQSEKYWRSNGELVLQSGYPPDSPATYEFVMRHHASLHQLDGWLLLTKYVREAVVVAFALLALMQLVRFRSPVRSAVASGGLVLLAAISATAALLAGQWLALLAGARSFAAWGIGMLSAPLVDDSVRRRLARVCAWTLLAQAALAAIELQRGMLIYAIFLFDHDIVRVVGTFNLPASLGAFAVVSWAVAWNWGGYSRRSLYALTVVLVALLVVNGSAVAWTALLAIVLAAAYARLGARWRPLLLSAMLPVAIISWLALPSLTGRWDVHDSLWGRIAPVTHYADEHLSTSQILFGTGFGLGTNALASRGEAIQASGLPDRPVGDSMPAVLFWQVGLIGLLCAYALFAFALSADPASRGIGIALLVSSVAINISELFPVNLIMGFWLANAAFGKADDEPA